MQKVLFISHFPDLKMGGQQSMLALIKNLDRSRYVPQAILPATGTDLYNELHAINCKIDILPPTPPLKIKNLCQLLRYYFKVRHIIKRDNISIIHPDHERDTILCAFAAKHTKCKTVWHVRLTVQTPNDKSCAKLADGIIGISDGCRRRFKDDISSKYRTIFNGVDCDKFCESTDINRLRKTLSLPPDKFIVLFVGQYKPGKGIFDLAQAAKLLSDKGNTGFHVVYCGSPLDAATYNQFQNFISGNKLNEIISVLPQQSEIQRFMQTCDILILPSHEGVEGMGRVLFEAMACGKPVIGTNISGVNEAITPETGILVPEKSPEEIANAIIKFMSDKNYYISCSQHARQRALNVFDIKCHAENVMNFYDMV